MNKVVYSLLRFFVTVIVELLINIGMRCLMAIALISFILIDSISNRQIENWAYGVVIDIRIEVVEDV